MLSVILIVISVILMVISVILRMVNVFFYYSESLVLYGERILTREDILSMRATENMTSAVVDCWAILLNDLEAKEKIQPTAFYFGIRHTVCYFMSFFINCVISLWVFVILVGVFVIVNIYFLLIKDRLFFSGCIVVSFLTTICVNSNGYTIE